MKEIALNDLKENFAEILSEEWMLITAGNIESFNTMTASWGGIGHLWNRDIVQIYVRPERYTYEFIEKSDCFTLSFMGMDQKKIHSICGNLSGRDTDKVSQSGLKPISAKNGSVAFEQSRLTIECKKIYSDSFKSDCFIDKDILEKFYTPKDGGLHYMYIGEITNIYIK